MVNIWRVSNLRDYVDYKDKSATDRLTKRRVLKSQWRHNDTRNEFCEVIICRKRPFDLISRGENIVMSPTGQRTLRCIIILDPPTGRFVIMMTIY